MELLKDYDCTILYHFGKANVVANALSKKSMGSLAQITLMKRPLVRQIHQQEAEGICFGLRETGVLLSHIKALSSLVEQIKIVQGKDPKLSKLIEGIKSGKNLDFALDP